MLSLDECYERCRVIALGHYENFPVGSVLLPRRIRNHVYAIYAFVRTADDFADLPDRSTDQRLKLLEDYRLMLERGADDPVIRAVRATLASNRLSVDLLHRMLDAFEFDARGHVDIESYEQLRWYTARSAEPIGELMLRLFGYAEPTMIKLSAEITTGLQLLNFVQDIQADLSQHRYYFPREDLLRFGINSRASTWQHEGLLSLLKFELDRVKELLGAGQELPEMVQGRLRFELRAIVLGALTLIDQLRASYDRGDLLRQTLTPQRHSLILLRSLVGRIPVEPSSP